MKLIALLIPAIVLLTMFTSPAADPLPQWRDLFNGKDLTGWVDVNTSPETWSVRDGLLVCTGKPIGVMRSNRQYENFKRKGYLCLESEGSEIHFRNISIMELPPGITTPEQTAEVVE